MATTQADLDAAKQNEGQAAAALQAARAELARVLALPLGAERVTQEAAAEANVKHAQEDLRRAERNTSRVAADYRAENPKPKNPSDGEEARVRALADEEAQRDKNEKDPEIGARVTDTVAETIRDRRRPKPPAPARVDSPAQQVTAGAAAQNAATGAARQQESVRSNTAREGLTASGQQLDAMQTAIRETNVVGEQTLRENIARSTAAQNQEDSVRGAATSLLNAQVTMRGQDQNHIQTRASFMTGMFNSIMSNGMKLMQGLPKGSQVAVNAVKAMFTLMNEMYNKSGLGADLPRPDPQSPEIRALRIIAGKADPNSVSTMPSAALLQTQTAVTMAFRGFPPVGWNGPTGTPALALLDNVDEARKAQGLPPVGNNGPVVPGGSRGAQAPTLNDQPPAAPGTTAAPGATKTPEEEKAERLAMAARSDAGRKIEQEELAPVQNLVNKPTKTPEEQKQIDDAKNRYNTRIQSLVPRPPEQPAQQTTTTPTEQPATQPGTQPVTTPEEPEKPPVLGAPPEATKPYDPSTALSYDAMVRQVENEKKNTGFEVNDENKRLWEREAATRLVQGDRPESRYYNNPEDAAIGSKAVWGAQPIQGVQREETLPPKFEAPEPAAPALPEPEPAYKQFQFDVPEAPQVNPMELAQSYEMPPLLQGPDFNFEGVSMPNQAASMPAPMMAMPEPEPFIPPPVETYEPEPPMVDWYEPIPYVFDPAYNEEEYYA